MHVKQKNTVPYEMFRQQCIQVNVITHMITYSSGSGETVWSSASTLAAGWCSCKCCVSSVSATCKHSTVAFLRTCKNVPQLNEKGFKAPQQNSFLIPQLLQGCFAGFMAEPLHFHRLQQPGFGSGITVGTLVVKVFGCLAWPHYHKFYLKVNVNQVKNILKQKEK